QCNVVHFQKDGKRAYMVTNKGPDMDLAALELIDPGTGKAEIVESDPLKRVDFSGAIFSDVTDELALTQYQDDHLRRYFKDKDIEAGSQWLRAKFPGKDVGRASWTKDEQLWVVVVNSDTEPGEIYLFDRKSHKLDLQFRFREKLPRQALAEMKTVHYKS